MKKIILFVAVLVLSFTFVNAQVAKKGSVGVGLGVPYGVIGINGEFALHKYFSLSAGLGTTAFAGVGYAIGARTYMRPAEVMFRPRVSLHYGVTGLIAAQDSEKAKKYNGVAVGVGFQEMFGAKRRSGFDFEILYMASTGGMQDEIDKMNESGNYSKIETPGRVKILLGYRFGF
jgi:hypothetical protein